MTIYCIRTRRSEDPAWRYVGARGGITEVRADAQKWDVETVARGMLPHYRRRWPGREFRAGPITSTI